MSLTDAIERLEADDPEVIARAARDLGLLIEAVRLRGQGRQQPSEILEVMGDLVELVPNDSSFETAANALVKHVEANGLNSNPTVAWALGMTNQSHWLGPLAILAEGAVGDPRCNDLLYQIAAVLAAVDPGGYRAILTRIASEHRGEAGDLVRDLIETHGWE